MRFQFAWCLSIQKSGTISWRVVALNVLLEIETAAVVHVHVNSDRKKIMIPANLLASIKEISFEILYSRDKPKR